MSADAWNDPTIIPPSVDSNVDINATLFTKRFGRRDSIIPYRTYPIIGRQYSDSVNPKVPMLDAGEKFIADDMKRKG
jgi:hypothetical protein